MYYYYYQGHFFTSREIIPQATKLTKLQFDRFVDAKKRDYLIREDRLGFPVIDRRFRSDHLDPQVQEMLRRRRKMMMSTAKLIAALAAQYWISPEQADMWKLVGALPSVINNILDEMPQERREIEISRLRSNPNIRRDDALLNHIADKLGKSDRDIDRLFEEESTRPVRRRR